MNSGLPTDIDKAAFLGWVQTRERKRFELVSGAVVEAEPHTLGHARVCGSLARILHDSLDRKRWHTLLSFGVETGPKTIRDPDILVDRGGKAKDVLANAPVLIAEVPSPRSVTTDLGDKPAEYMNLPSVRVYLVLSQDEAKAWTWTRDESGHATGPTIIEGEDGIIRIPSLAIALSLSEIYADILLPNERSPEC